MTNMHQMIPSMPKIAENMAFFEIAGVRYVVMPLGPTPPLVEEGRKAAQMPTVPETTPSKDAAADVAPTSDANGSAPRKFVYGLKGLQELFHCSKTTAYNIKHSGRIDKAISQIGNMIIVDAEKALELLKK